MSQTPDRTMLTPPDHPDLVGLLRGELTNVEIISTGDHLDTCHECRADLAETAVGHALLSGAGRTLGHRAEPAGSEAAPALPPAPEVPRSGARWLRPLTAVAAAAALVAGTAVVTTQLVGDNAEQRREIQAQVADLEPVEGSGGGEVRMLDEDGAVNMTVQTRDLPQLRAGEFYYVWLFNPKTEKMLGLGVLRPDGTGGFEIPGRLVKGYEVVDISLEKDDGDPEHSVTSVLRAEYAGDAVVSS